MHCILCIITKSNIYKCNLNICKLCIVVYYYVKNASELWYCNQKFLTFIATLVFYFPFLFPKKLTVISYTR